ncbi:hypothetical protein ENBRE01_2048 [Enteropsectra breve]|nr:hypothetical protein ENBRE01_2048 [Enteropsectra breve]
MIEKNLEETNDDHKNKKLVPKMEGADKEEDRESIKEEMHASADDYRGECDGSAGAAKMGEVHRYNPMYYDVQAPYTSIQEPNYYQSQSGTKNFTSEQRNSRTYREEANPMYYTKGGYANSANAGYYYNDPMNYGERKYYGGQAYPGSPSYYNISPYYLNKEYISKDYAGKEYPSKEYISKDYPSKDYANKEYSSKDFINKDYGTSKNYSASKEYAGGSPYNQPNSSPYNKSGYGPDYYDYKPNEIYKGYGKEELHREPNYAIKNETNKYVNMYKGMEAKEPHPRTRLSEYSYNPTYYADRKDGKYSDKLPREMKKKNKHRMCSNCQATSTPSWRRGGNGKTLLCNACGLYQKLHNRSRPYSVTAEGKTKALKGNYDKLICVVCNQFFPSCEVKQMQSGLMCEGCAIFYKGDEISSGYKKAAGYGGTAPAYGSNSSGYAGGYDSSGYANGYDSSSYPGIYDQAGYRAPYDKSGYNSMGAYNGGMAGSGYKINDLDKYNKAYSIYQQQNSKPKNYAIKDETPYHVYDSNGVYIDAPITYSYENVGNISNDIGKESKYGENSYALEEKKETKSKEENEEDGTEK